VLFDELEVKRADNTKEKLPDYPAGRRSAPRTIEHASGREIVKKQFAGLRGTATIVLVRTHKR